jgi:hypothetical protein
MEDDLAALEASASGDRKHLPDVFSRKVSEKRPLHVESLCRHLDISSVAGANDAERVGS